MKPGASNRSLGHRGLRTQQIIAEESGAADVVDPLGGSYHVERLTSLMIEEVKAELDRIATKVVRSKRWKVDISNAKFTRLPLRIKGHWKLENVPSLASTST